MTTHRLDDTHSCSLPLAPYNLVHSGLSLYVSSVMTYDSSMLKLATFYRRPWRVASTHTEQVPPPRLFGIEILETDKTVSHEPYIATCKNHVLQLTSTSPISKNNYINHFCKKKVRNSTNSTNFSRFYIFRDCYPTIFNSPNYPGFRKTKWQPYIWCVVLLKAGWIRILIFFAYRY